MHDDGQQQLLQIAQSTRISNEFILYKRRWIMLLLFSTLSFTNAMLWITYSPIALMVMKYYNVNAVVVNSLSLVCIYFHHFLSSLHSSLAPTFNLLI